MGNQNGDNTGRFRLRSKCDRSKFSCIINEGPSNVLTGGIKEVGGLSMSTEERRNNNCA